MNANVLYENSDAIIAYVISKQHKMTTKHFKGQVIQYIRHYCEKYLNQVFPIHIVNDFYELFEDRFQRLYDEIKALKERIKMGDYEASKSVARAVLMKKVFNNKNKLSLAQVKRLTHFKPLLEQDINDIYEEYEREWKKEHPTEKPKPKTETFSDKLDKFVVEHMNDNLLTFDEFERVTSGWNRGRKSINQCYEEYKQKYFQQPGTTVNYKEIRDTGLIGFKSKDKMKSLMKVFPNRTINENTVKSSFDLKNSIKHYQLHK